MTLVIVRVNVLVSRIRHDLLNAPVLWHTILTIHHMTLANFASQAIFTADVTAPRELHWLLVHLLLIVRSRSTTNSLVARWTRLTKFRNHAGWRRCIILLL